MLSLINLYYFSKSIATVYSAIALRRHDCSQHSMNLPFCLSEFKYHLEQFLVSVNLVFCAPLRASRSTSHHIRLARKFDVYSFISIYSILNTNVIYIYIQLFNGDVSNVLSKYCKYRSGSIYSRYRIHSIYSGDSINSNY